MFTIRAPSIGGTSIHSPSSSTWSPPFPGSIQSSVRTPRVLVTADALPRRRVLRDPGVANDLDVGGRLIGEEVEELRGLDPERLRPRREELHPHLTEPIPPLGDDLAELRSALGHWFGPSRRR